jgi:inward rectifier potassium channel
MAPVNPPAEEPKDLGLGSRVAQQSRLRFLNRDGSFNVRRRGLSFFRSLSLYHALLSMSWTKFTAVLMGGLVAFNGLFAFAYVLCGEGAIHGATAETLPARILESFFFSVQTATTIGYGHLSPVGIATNIVVSVEVMVSLLGFALATGILFARFSRPDARVAFSQNAVFAPYQGITAFEFRIANERASQLVQVEVKVIMSRFEEGKGSHKRVFYELTLERGQVQIFPLNWTIVHPIDDKSPLFGVTQEALTGAETEFMVFLTALDETFWQTVHTRTSYKPEEIVWGAKFSDMFEQADDGVITVDLRRIHEIEPAPIP